jgi:hypothetical protein
MFLITGFIKHNGSHYKKYQGHCSGYKASVLLAEKYAEDCDFVWVMDDDTSNLVCERRKQNINEKYIEPAFSEPITFKWISEDGNKSARISVGVNGIKNSDLLYDVDARCKAYDALAEVIGEENLRFCVIA